VSIFAKLVRGASINVLEHGFKVVVMFVITPLMIRCLGKEDYGTWILAIAIIGYFRLLDLGLSFAGLRFLGIALGADDREEYRSLVCKLFRLYIQIGLATLALTALAVSLLSLFIGDPGVAATVRILVAGFGVATAFRFFTRIFEVILKSHVRYDLIGISSISKTILQAGLLIWLLLAGYGLKTLLIAHILIDVVDQLLLAFFARRVEVDLHLRGSYDGKVGTRELLSYSASAMVSNVGQSLRQGVDPLIITHVSGVRALPVYNIGARFLSMFTDVVNAIFGGTLMAAFSQTHGRGDSGELNEHFLKAIRYSTVVAMLGGCGLMMFGQAFIARWVGSDFAISGTVLWILTPATTLSLCQYPIWSLFYSQNKQHWVAIFTLVSGIFNLALSFYLAWRIGWIGVVWATCVEMALGFGFVMPLLASRVCEIPLKRYYWQIFIPGIKVTLASLAYWVVVRSYVVPAYDRLFVLGAGYVAVISTIIWFMIFTKPERSQLWKILKPARAKL
jgi:O-antigen/teichoic acid export membrane protein